MLCSKTVATLRLCIHNNQSIEKIFLKRKCRFYRKFEYKSRLFVDKLSILKVFSLTLYLSNYNPINQINKLIFFVLIYEELFLCKETPEKTHI